MGYFGGITDIKIRVISLILRLQVNPHESTESEVKERSQKKLVNLPLNTRAMRGFCDRTAKIYEFL